MSLPMPTPNPNPMRDPAPLRGPGSLPAPIDDGAAFAVHGQYPCRPADAAVRLTAIDSGEGRPAAIHARVVEVWQQGMRLIAAAPVTVGAPYTMRTEGRDGWSDPASVVFSEAKPLPSNPRARAAGIDPWDCWAELLWPLETLTGLGLGLGSLLPDLSLPPISDVADGIRIRADGSVIGAVRAGDPEGGREDTGPIPCPGGEIEIDADLVVDKIVRTHGLVGGTLRVTEVCERCDMLVAGGFEAEDGRLVGGRFEFAGSLRVATLGSAADTETRLIPNPLSRLLFLERRFDRCREQTREMEEQLAILRVLGSSASHEQREEVTLREFQAMELREALRQLTDDIRAEKDVTRDPAPVFIRIEEMVEPGAAIEFGGWVYEVTEAMRGPIVFRAEHRRGLFIETGTGGEPVKAEDHDAIRRRPLQQRYKGML